MLIVERKIEDIKPYPNNPRDNDAAVEAVANSIREFGFKVPIIVDRDGVIIAGHTRLKAAKKLGLNTVPTISADDLTPEQVKAFRLADNKTAESSEWDDELLFQELNELKGLEDIDMTDYGFAADLSPDLFSDVFSLDGGDDGPSIRTMNVTVATEQMTLIEDAIEKVKGTEELTGGNANGNAIAEICRQWRTLKTS